MNTQGAEWWWLDGGQTVGQADLARICGLSAAELAELVEYGALVPSGDTPGEARFAADCVHPLREAARMRARFDLDLFTAGLLTGYLHRIEALEQQVRVLQGQLPRPAHPERDGPTPWREHHDA